MLLLFPIMRRLLMLVAFLAIPLIVAEFGARKLVGDAVSHAVAARIGVSPKVGFGATPLLLQIAHGRLDAVTVSAEHARFDDLPPMALRGTLRDVHLRSLTSLQGAIGSLSVEAKLGSAGVRDLLATPACIQSLPSGLRAALSSSPRVDLLRGRIDVLPPRGRAVELRLHPQVVPGGVAFAIAELQLDGRAVPAAQLAGLRAQTDCSRTLRSEPFGVTLRSASVTSGALDLGFAGAGASFSAIS